jgi:Acetyltransferase (isoleucine patch superfamily)
MIIFNRLEKMAEKEKAAYGVCIGAYVCILPGVTMGDNMFVGAGSGVTKDIPSRVVAYGNPCRVIRWI